MNYKEGSWDDKWSHYIKQKKSFQLRTASNNISFSDIMNFYQHAGRILDKLARHEGTIKGLIIGDPKVWDKKKMYALVCETLKCKL